MSTERAAGQEFFIPPSFEKYLGQESLTIKNSRDLRFALSDIGSPESLELVRNLNIFHHLELEPMGTSRRDIVLIEDTSGKKTMVVVCRDLNPPDGRNKVYGQLAVIGGMGLYDTPEGESPTSFALDHTKLLSVIMRRKCWMAGLELGGMKGTIPGESDWESSEILQKATGFLFSPSGIFQDAITGTDARQTPDTIAAMAKGSEIGGNHQIAGMIEELDTPASCKFSLGETYCALQEIYQDSVTISELSGSTVLIEGFGRIGRTATRVMLKLGAKVVIADPLLTNENELLPDLPDVQSTKEFIKGKLSALEQEYGGKIRVVKTDELADQKAQVFCPCASVEGLMDEAKLSKLAENGVKVVLAGANNLFGKSEVWQRARLAHELGIVVPPEILANCGSVTAASMEPLLRDVMDKEKEQFQAGEEFDLNIQERQQQIAQTFVQEQVMPHIQKNTRRKLDMLLKIAEEEGVDLYTAGEIAFRKAFGIDYKVNNGVLQI